MSTCVPVEHNGVWKSHRTWFLVRPPSRPATWQLNLIRTWLGSLEMHGDVAILGSTPEFQDLIAEFDGLKPVVIDRSAEFSSHACHQRRRRDRHGYDPERLIGDWTEVLENHQSRFVAVLSDLTSGNVPYNQRERHYSAVAHALRPSGLFADRILTREGRLRNREEVYRRFDAQPISLHSLNELNCELLFTSDLLVGEELRVAELLETAGREWTTESGQAYLDALQLITPPSGTWWYGRPWELLSKLHGASLCLVGDHPEPLGTAYSGHARLLLKRRESTDVPPEVANGRLHAERSRAIAVLKEAQEMLDSLPLPDLQLGEAFLHRLVERAVFFRDSCLRFRMECLEVESQHWRFMTGLFERIRGRASSRDSTYAFVWRFEPCDVLFSPDAPEWKTLFAHAIELAANSQIFIRALVVTNQRDAERLQSLNKLAQLLGVRFQIKVILPVDFEAIKNSDGLVQCIDFGVFGVSAAFLTKSYEPVVGEYVWAPERVIGLHELFDRIWDQASWLDGDDGVGVVRQDWADALAELERSDRELPVSCLARLVAHGGSELKLNKSELNRVYGECARWHNGIEVRLRMNAARALVRGQGAEAAVNVVMRYLHKRDSGRVGDRHASSRQSAVEQADISRLLESMFFKELCEFVVKHWRELAPVGDRKRVEVLMSLANRRPHAHADQSIDLADFALYRNAIRSLETWLGKWERGLDLAFAPGGV